MTVETQKVLAWQKQTLSLPTKTKLGVDVDAKVWGKLAYHRHIEDTNAKGKAIFTPEGFAITHLPTLRQFPYWFNEEKDVRDFIQQLSAKWELPDDLAEMNATSKERVAAIMELAGTFESFYGSWY